MGQISFVTNTRRGRSSLPLPSRHPDGRLRGDAGRTDMRRSSGLAALLIIFACGRQTIELFPGNGDSSDAASQDGGDTNLDDAASDGGRLPADSGRPASDAATEAAALPLEGGCESNADCPPGENP